MFGIGTSELILILVIALLVIGPRELPKLGREVGKAFRSFQRAKDDIKDSFTREIVDINREVENKVDEEKRDERG